MNRQMWVCPSDAALLARHGLADFDCFFTTSLAEPMPKPGLPPWRWRGRLRLPDEAGREHVFYLKRFDGIPVGYLLRSRLRDGSPSGPAAREVANARRLHAAGVPTVRIAAWGIERRARLERRSFVLTRAAPGEALERLLGELAALPRPRLRVVRRALLAATADVVRRLHAARLVHRDLYLSHLFADAQSDPPAITLIDIQRIMRPRWRWRRWVVKDLAALDYSTPRWAVSTTDRLRWLERYLGRPWREGSSRRLARQVARRSRRLRERLGEPPYAGCTRCVSP